MLELMTFAIFVVVVVIPIVVILFFVLSIIIGSIVSIVTFFDKPSKEQQHEILIRERKQIENKLKSLKQSKNKMIENFNKSFNYNAINNLEVLDYSCTNAESKIFETYGVLINGIRLKDSKFCIYNIRTKQYTFGPWDNDFKELICNLFKLKIETKISVLEKQVLEYDYAQNAKFYESTKKGKQNA